MKKRWPYAALFALVAIGYALTLSPVRATFTWKGLEWDSYNRSSVVFEKVGGDTVRANRVRADESFRLPRSSTNNLPTCNNSREGEQIFDTTENLVKVCSNLSGTFEWLATGGDADQDGFTRTIDDDDDDNTVFARNLTAGNVRAGTDIGPLGGVILTGTLRYEETNTYTGTNVAIEFSGTQSYLVATDTDRRRCAAMVICREKGDLSVESFTSGTTTQSPRRGIVNCDNLSNVFDYMQGGAALSLGSPVANTNVITGVTCTGIGG